jgi:hypothetical protein
MTPGPAGEFGIRYLQKGALLMALRWIAALACLAALAGAGLAQQQDKSPDEQAKELIGKYQALPEKDQLGPEGAGLIKQLKALAAQLTGRSREAAARLEAAHNLRQLGLALQHFDGKDPMPGVDPQLFLRLLPYLDQGAVRPRWEYKVLAEADILKLGKEDLAAGLTKLGEDGWELVGFEKSRFVLKRQNWAPLPAP